MRRGLGMWVMSKLVLVIFLFSLVLVLTLFMRVYSDKIISDTAQSYTLLWSEVANGALLYRSSSDSVYLEDIIRVREANRDYTVMVSKVDKERVVLFLSWYKHDTIPDMQERGFAAAAALNMPEIIDDGGILLFEGASGEIEFKEVGTTLLVKPSETIDRDSTLMFYRNDTYFCVGSVKEGIPIEEAINKLGNCCQEDWGSTDGCY